MSASSIPIVDEQPDFYVVAKPCGVDIHCSADGPGLIEQLKQQQNQAVFPVHRLDKATSGLLLVARGQKAVRDLSLLFQQRQVAKYYLALSVKKPSKKQGLIKGDMCKARNGCWRLSRSLANPAVTYFFSYGNVLNSQRVFILRPYTGKTHQLRVAMKSLGAAILGDTRYGGQRADRMYLHAYKLSFAYAERHFSYELPPTAGEIFVSKQWQCWLTDLPDVEQLPWPVIASTISECAQ